MPEFLSSTPHTHSYPANDVISMEDSSHWRFLAAITFLLPLFNYFILVETGCPFQNPFWFVEKPMVVSVFDENGEMVANKIRVMWGRMENFKCVDYFQVIILS